MSTAFGKTYAFLSLPGELIDRILCNLDLKSLLKCKQVCKRLKTHIETTKEIQYIIELAVAGCEKNHHNTWSSARRLDCLYKYQSAWEQLEWPNELVVPMLGGRLWELYGGVLVRSDNTGTFHFLKLPSETRHIKEESWKHKPTIDGIRDFGIDPSQDLLVWITAPTPTSPSVSLHLQTLRTAENHPLARQPVIHYSQRTPTGRWHFSIKIMQDYIGLQVLRRPPVDEEGSVDSTEFLVWNWKEDKLELAAQTNDIQSFCFLSDRHVVLANHYISQDLDLVATEGYLVLIDFKAEDETKKPLSQVRHSMKLCYPNRVAGAAVMQFNISCEPTPGWTPGKDDTTPFFIARENRVFTVSMLIQQQREFAFDHFIPLSAFKKCLDRLDASLGQQLEWSDWAPTETRLIRTPLPASDVWVCFAYGSRSIGREIIRKLGRVCFSVVVYDFNQLLLRRDEARGKEVTPGSYSRINKPGVIRNDTVWEVPVETALPYRRYSKVLPIQPGGHSLMCTADNLVLVDIKAKQYRIYSF